MIGVARSNLVEHLTHQPRQQVERPPTPADELVAEILGVIADLPTYGYRRVDAILRRRAIAEGRPPSNQSIGRVRWAFTLTAAAYNLIRLPKLIGATA